MYFLARLTDSNCVENEMPPQPESVDMERMVEVDMDRKEELILAKQLRACRVSILPRVRGVEVDMDRKEELILAKQLNRACRVSILPRVRGGGGGHGQEGGAHPGQAAQGLQGLHPTQGNRSWRGG